jgi:hypothetical protein
VELAVISLFLDEKRERLVVLDLLRPRAVVTRTYRLVPPPRRYWINNDYILHFHGGLF